MKPLIVAAVICVTLVVSYVVYRIAQRRGAPSSTAGQLSNNVQVATSGIAVVPSSVSTALVAKSGLSTSGSEDMSKLLVPPAAKQDLKSDKSPDYRPLDSIEWAIDIDFQGDPILQQSQLADLYSAKWRAANGMPTVYGWSPETKHWTFLLSGGVPKTFTKLCFGWTLCGRSEEEPNFGPDDLERFKQSAADQLRSIGRPRIRANRTASEAIGLAQRLSSLVEKCQRDIAVVLVAPPGHPYDGREVWDVMYCLGLKWGDGDLFHWINESAVGDDSYFSVHTTTAPGYLLASSAEFVGEFWFGENAEGVI